MSPRQQIRVILLTSSLFDDISTKNWPNLLGVISALFACAEVARTIAVKHDLAVIDFHGLRTALMLRLQAADPTSSKIGRDRVHHGNPGNYGLWKPNVSTILAEAEKLLNEARVAAQPTPHRLNLTPLSSTS